MEDISLLHVLYSFRYLNEELSRFTLIQGHHLCVLLILLSRLSVVSFHSLERFDFYLELVPLNILKNNVERLFIFKIVIELRYIRTFQLTLNPYFVESGMSCFLFVKRLLVEDFHCIEIICYSTLYLVDIGTCSFTKGLASDNFIVTQS